MSRQIQHTDINNLINSNEIKLDSARIGCCNRFYLTFPNDDHKYFYNSNKSISKVLQNKISKHLYTTSKKSLNRKTTILSDKVMPANAIANAIANVNANAIANANVDVQLKIF